LEAIQMICALTRKMSQMVAILTLGTLSACGQVDLKWSEEVQLEDGPVIVVKRAAQGEIRREIGGPGGWKPTEITIDFSSINMGKRPPNWKAAYVPVLLDYQTPDEKWSVVATFAYCDGWYDLGRPALPYIEYQSIRGGNWQIIPLEQRLIGRATNLLSGMRSGGEPPYISLQDKKSRDRKAADKYRQILSIWRTTC
jgi:hypothetical protein